MPNNKPRYSLTVDGKQRTVEADKFNDNVSTFIQDMPDATIRMKDSNGAEKDVKLNDLSDALYTGYQYVTTDKPIYVNTKAPEPEKPQQQVAPKPAVAQQQPTQQSQTAPKPQAPSNEPGLIDKIVGAVNTAIGGQPSDMSLGGMQQGGNLIGSLFQSEKPAQKPAVAKQQPTQPTDGNTEEEKRAIDAAKYQQMVNEQNRKIADYGKEYNKTLQGIKDSNPETRTPTLNYEVRVAENAPQEFADQGTVIGKDGKPHKKLVGTSSPEDISQEAYAVSNEFSKKKADEIARTIVSHMPEHISTDDGDNEELRNAYYNKDAVDMIAEAAGAMGMTYHDFFNVYVRPRISNAVSERYRGRKVTAPGLSGDLGEVAKQGKSYDERWMNDDERAMYDSLWGLFHNDLNKLQAEGEKASLAEWKKNHEGTQLPGYTGVADMGVGAMSERAKNYAADPQKAVDDVLNKLYAENGGANGGATEDMDRQAIGNLLYRNMIKYLVDQRVPKSKWGYVLQGFADSDLGEIFKAVTKTQYERHLDNLANDKYVRNLNGFSGLLAQGGHEATKFLGDAWEYWLGGKAGKAVTGAIRRRAIAGLTADLTARGIAEAEAKNIAIRIANARTKSAAEKAFLHAASGSATLGSAQAISGGLRQGLTPAAGQKKAEIQERRANGETITKEQEDKEIAQANAKAHSVGAVAKSAGGSGLSGAAMGATMGIGSLAGDATSKFLSKYFGDVTSAAGGYLAKLNTNAAAATALGQAEGALTGQQPEGSTGQQFASNLVNFAMLDGMNYAPKVLGGHPIRDFRQWKEYERSMGISEEDQDRMRNLGYGDLMDTVDGLVSDRLRTGSPNAGTELSTQRHAESPQETKVNQGMLNMLADPRIPEELKRKYYAVVTGDTSRQLSPIVASEITQDEDGNTYLVTYNKNGNVVSDRQYRNEQAAKEAQMKIGHEQDENLTEALQQNVFAKDADAVMEEAYNAAAEAYKNGGELNNGQKTLIYLYQNKAQLTKAIQAMASGEALSDADKKLVNLYNAVKNTLYSMDGNIPRIVNDVEEDNGLGTGGLQKARNGHTEKEAKRIAKETGEEIVHVGGDVWRTMSEDQAVKDYQKRLYDYINDIHEGTGEDVAEPKGLPGRTEEPTDTQEQPSNPEQPTQPEQTTGEGDVALQRPTQQEAEPGTEQPSQPTDTQQPSQPTNAEQPEQPTQTTQPEGQSQVQTVREQGRQRGLSVESDETQLAQIQEDSDLANKRFNNAFQGNQLGEFRNGLIQAVEDDDEDAIQALFDKYGDRLSTEQKEAAMGLVENGAVQNGIEESITNQTMQYQDARKQELDGISDSTGTITEITLQDGSTVYYKSGDITNQYGGIIVVDGNGDTQQIPVSSIAQVGQPTSAKAILDEDTNNFAQGLQNGYQAMASGASMLPGQETTINVGGQSFHATMETELQDGNIQLRLDDGSPLVLTPDQLQQARKAARDANTTQQLAEAEQQRQMKEREDQYNKGVVGYGEGNPDFSAPKTDARTAAELMHEQDKKAGKASKERLSDIQSERDKLNDQIRNAQWEMSRQQRWLELNGDTYSEEERASKQAIIDGYQQQINEWQQRVRKLGEVRNAYMSNEERRQFQSNRRKTMDDVRKNTELGIKNGGLTPTTPQNGGQPQVEVPDAKTLLEKYATQADANAALSEMRDNVMKSYRDGSVNVLSDVRAQLRDYEEGMSDLSNDELQNLYLQQAGARQAEEAAMQQVQKIKNLQGQLSNIYKERNKAALNEMSPRERRATILSGAKTPEELQKKAHEAYAGATLESRLDDTEPETLEEYVSQNMPTNLNWEGTGSGITQKRGLKQELGLSRGIGRNFDSNGINSLLAPKGQGISVDEAAHALWEGRPSQFEGATTQDMRNTLLDLIANSPNARYIKSLTIRNRINEVEGYEQAAEEQEQWLQQQADEEAKARQAAIDTYNDYLDDTAKDAVPSDEVSDYLSGLYADEIAKAKEEADEQEEAWREYEKEKQSLEPNNNNNGTEREDGTGEDVDSEPKQPTIHAGNGEGEAPLRAEETHKPNAEVQHNAQGRTNAGTEAAPAGSGTTDGGVSLPTVKKGKAVAQQRRTQHVDFATETEEQSKAFEESIPKMTDEELLGYIAQDSPDATKQYHPALGDEYDYRHRDEEQDYYNFYEPMLDEEYSKGGREAVEETYNKAWQDWVNGGYASAEDRTRLSAQINACEDWLSEHDKENSLGATDTPEKVDAERQKVNTEPTEAQKEAGNYKKGHIKVDGYDISIENPKGSVREKKDANGKVLWRTPMHYDYGYIKNTEGTDGDHIDVYLSDNPTEGNVYVVDQVNQSDGSFDEHKVMYGFPSMEAARDAYKSQYEDGWKVGTITEVSREDFKKWVNSSHRKTKPFSEYKSVKAEAAKQRPTEPNAPTGGNGVDGTDDHALIDIQENGSKVEGMYYYDTLHEEYVKLGKLKYDETIYPHYGYNTVYGRVNAWAIMNDFRKGKLKTREEVQKLQAFDKGAAAQQRPTELSSPTGTNGTDRSHWENGADGKKLESVEDVLDEVETRQNIAKYATMKADELRKREPDELRTLERKELAQADTNEQLAKIAKGEKQEKLLKDAKVHRANGELAGRIRQEVKAEREQLMEHRSNERKAQLTKREAALRNGVNELMREAGIEVIDDEKEGQRVLDMANGARLSKDKKRALETASPNLNGTDHQTVIPSADGAKVLKNLDTLVNDFENLSNSPKFFIGSLARALGAQKHGSNSEYATFETKNGRVVTIRLANHNAKISTFDNHNESDGISIVITANNNAKLTNDGNAHVTEFYYNALKLRRAEGKPLADIVRSIKQALYSGEFKDTTGLAERQEVNVGEIARQQRVYHGSANDFDAFDTMNHLSEGEGSHAFGAGTYVADQRDLGVQYAEIADQNKRLQFELDGKITSTNNYSVNSPEYYAVDMLRRFGKEGAIARLEKRAENYRELSDKFIKIYKDAAELLKNDRIKIPKKNCGKFLYEVDIPKDDGKNYLDWDGELSRNQADTIRKRLYEAVLALNDDYKGSEMYLAQDLSVIKKGGHIGDTYGTISDYLGSDKAASEFLHDLGYTGIKVHAAHNSNDARYKDNWNYVIFNDKDLKITDKVRFFRTTNGEAYGFTVGGKIYIDPRIATSETPIHEYAHLWAEALRKVNPKEWVNVVELMKGCKEVWEQVTKEYPELETDDEIAEEVLAHYSGKRGAERLRAEAAKAADGAKSDLEKDKVKSAFSRLKDAIKKAWKHIAEDILHIHFTTAEEVADKVMYDLLNKVNPNRFNLSKSVEEGKDLIAVHNLTEDKLKQSLELGGFPMPSIAITKSSMGHAEYGDISLLFGKDTINPSDSRNKVYSGDAWAPTFPHVSYKLDEKKLRDIYSRALKAGNLPFFNSARLHPENLKDRVDGNDSAKIIESGKKDYGMKQMFLSEKGNPVKGYVQKTVDKYSPERVELLQEILDKIGVEGLRNGKYEDELKQIVGSYRHVDLDSVKPFFAKLAMRSALRDAIDFAENGNKKVENDVEATQKEIDSRIAPKEYDQWLHDMLEGITEKKGIRNNTDPYTRSGDRLKWERLYDAVTLDNVLKAMKAQPAKSGGFFNSIFGASAKELSNLNEVREEAKRRIKSVPEEEFKAEKDKILSRLEKISLPSVERSNSISGAMDFVENVKDAVVHSHTPRGIYKYLSDIYPDMTIDVANEIADVVKDIQSMSTRYLEAKPYRAVGFDEVRAAVVPSDTEAKIVQQLKDKGIPVYTYEKGNAEERRQVVNDAAQEQSVKFHKAEFGNSKKAAENEVEAVNKRFNEELEKYKRGEVPIGTRFELGMPSKALESAGFPYLPISMRASLLSKKAGMERHPFEASDLRDLVKAMQMPIAIFKYSKDNMRNLIVDVKHGDKHFLVGITLDYKAGDIEVNSVSGLFPKESHEWIKWIQDGKAIRIDQKKKVLDLIDSLRTNPAESERIGLNLSSVAKIVEDFENPVIKGENLSFEGEDGSIKDVPTTPEETEESDVLYRIADDDEAAMLDKEPTVKVYRAMQLIDGKLYPPMMAGVKGKLVEPRELGQWEVADERPDIITHTKMNKKGEEIGYVKLDKGSKTSLGKRGTPIPAAYNPYWHTSRSPLNDQFKSAWIRPNIVTVEVEIPVSELTSGYRAKYAKDPVGETDWHSGSVTKQLTAQGHAPRKVILSRYDKPVRVLSAAETAERIIDYIGDYDVTIPENVVTPQVRVELEKRGIKIGEPEKGVKKTEQIREAIERGLSVSDDMLRDVEVFEDGERLPIIWREDGISVEGLNNEYDNVGQLLDAFREKYPDYISTIYDEDGQELSPSKAYSRQSDYKHPVLIVEPWRKYLSDYTGKRAVAMRQHTQRQQERAKEAVNDWARKLNLGDKVTVITDDSKLTGKKAKAKGWFDTKSGKITIVLPKHTSIDDVVRTMLHEGVAHYGLRELFGDKFDTFLDNVWNNASVDVKERLEKLAIKYDGNQRKATEEYLAGLAEDTDFDRAMQSGWWGKIKNMFLDMLAKVGLKLRRALTDADLRYVLWRSYENMKHPGETRVPADGYLDDPIKEIEGERKAREAAAQLRPTERSGNVAADYVEEPQEHSGEMRPLKSANDDKLSITSLPPSTTIPVTEIDGESPVSVQDAIRVIDHLPGSVDTLDGYHLNVSRTTRNKLKNEISKHKNDTAVLTAMSHIEEIVGKSLLIEEHRDRMKIDGERKPDNPSDQNIEKTQRFYGAATIDGVPYRVKSTAIVSRNRDRTRMHNYEITKIELLSPIASTRQKAYTAVDNNSITLAKLLKNVEFSYEKGRKLLDEIENNGYGNAVESASIKELGKRYRMGEAARTYSEGEQRDMGNAAEELGETLGGVAVTIEHNGKDGVKGSFDTSDNTVHVNMDEADGIEDVEATVCHEVLGHEGLKALFGSNKGVDMFGQFIYDNASKGLRRKIVEKADEEGYEWTDPLRFSKAAQEVFSDIASEGPRNAEEFSLWRKVKHYVIRALKSLGIRIRGIVNDHDLRYYVLKTGKAVKKWSMMDEEAQREAAESGRVMYSRRGKPRKRKDESWAHYFERLRTDERWKQAEEKAKAANDPMPEKEDYDQQAQDEYNKAMDDWRKSNNIQPGDKEPSEFPKRKDGESPQEYAVRVADYESQSDIWKTAPNVFDYMKKAQDEYRAAYEAWKTRYDLQEMENVDEKLYSGERIPSDQSQTDEQHYDKLEVEHAVEQDAERELGDAVGVDLSAEGAQRHAKLAVIERCKNLGSSNAEDAFFIHDLCKDIDALAKKKGMKPAELREKLIDVIESPIAQQDADKEVGKWVDVLNNMRAFQDAHSSIAADGVKAAMPELTALSHLYMKYGVKPSSYEQRKEIHDAAVRLADKFNDYYKDTTGYNQLFGDDIMQVGKYIVKMSEAAYAAAAASKLAEDPDVKAIVDRIHDWYDNFYHVIEDAGLRGDAGYFEDGYINHIWDKEKSDADAWEKYVDNFQRTKSGNMRHRTISTYADGIEVGLVPKFNDVVQIMSYYSRQNNEAIANKKFLDDLSFLTVSETNKDGEVTRTLPVLNSHKPDKFDEERYQMYHVPGVGDVWVLKDVASRFASIFGTMRTQDIPNWLSNIGKGYDLLGSTMKKIQLSISGFHAFALTEVAIAQMGPINGVRWAAKSLPIELKPLLMLKELFKGTLIDSIKNGTIPAYAHPEDFKFAASHLVQLGATQDYAAADVNMITEKFRDFVKGLRKDEAFMKKVAGNTLNPFAVALDWINKGMDKLLWNYLHDGLKIACFKHFAEQIDRRVEKEGLTAKQRERLLDEAGQYVNDTFGGQYWELLNVSPATLKWLRRAFLSPDWLISTQRHFFANFGFGSLYDPRTFAQYLSDQLPGGKKRKAKREKAQQGDGTGLHVTKAEDDGDIYRQFRSREARLCYILGVCVFFYTMMNGINAIMRARDEEKEKEKADEIRKTNPAYKSPYELAYPDGMKWYDYTMLGNSLGQQTHLFLGRYADGSEMYVRWGKQFREFPEMFIGSKGLDFPAPMIQRLMGKANPVIGLMRDNLGALGIWGFDNSNDIADIQAKYGKTIGLLAMNARHFFPYSLPTQADKEFKMIDVFMPSQKGFTRYKTVDYFKDFIKSGDIEGVERTYRAATMNGINVEDCLNAAITTLKAEQKDEMRDGIVDVTTACNAYDKAKTLTEKKAIRNKMIKLLAAGNYKAFTRAEALQMVNDYMNGNDVAEKDNDKYIQLSTSSDVRADYRLNAIGKQAKTYADSIKNAAKRGDTQTADRLAQRYGAWLEIDALAKQERSVVNKLKKQLGHGNDRAIMNEIRQARRDFQSQIDQVQPPK